MTTSALRVRPRNGIATAWRRTVALVRRRLVPSDGFALLGIVLLASVLTALSIRFGEWVPLTWLAVPLYLGGLLLTMRSLVLSFAAVTALASLATFARGGAPQDEVERGTPFVLLATGVLVLLLARSRWRLGVAGTRGESMLVDLRDRLRAQGTLPPLPAGWGAEMALRSAYGASFSGDFVVALRSTDGRTLEVALVDVSGKGVAAGTRALLLSGAFGGLLGALPAQDFLAAANAYVLRQGWLEGFATAVHFVLDLPSGEYAVRSAGHPPATQFVAGSGRWRVIEPVQGPLLGVLEDARYAAEHGRLDRGDAILLYTDGLIESPGLDLAVGIDRLLGEAERLVTRGFQHGARRLIDAVVHGEGDDRALALVWRE